jgi:glutamate 5-kinase
MSTTPTLSSPMTPPPVSPAASDATTTSDTADSADTDIHPARVRLRGARRVVVKVGSALLRDTARDPFAHFAAEIMALRRAGRDVVVVSSGAIALGLPILAMDKRPTDLPSLQAAAAAGQSLLMGRWTAAFSWFGASVAQVLLTHDDLKDRRRWKNARGALQVLLARGIIPIVNENDTVSVAEIKLGDNDTLAAAVAGVVDADTVVLLTGAAGLFTGDPGVDAAAVRVPVVEQLNDDVRAFAGAAAAHGTGGMVTKLEAASIAKRHGAQTVIAPGARVGVLAEVFGGVDVGTVVAASPADKRNERRRWIGTLKPRGSIHVDAGAHNALKKNGSLLFAGVCGVDGDFVEGDVVAVVAAGGVIGRGVVAVGADVARQVMGKKTHAAREEVKDLPDELIHRDELVLDDVGPLTGNENSP